MIAAESNGAKTVSTINPACFTCATLAGELADEWVELAAASKWKAGSVRGYRSAIVDFCQHVDETVPRAATASLAERDPDLHHAVTEWTRLLPSKYTAGSMMPFTLARQVRGLIARRVQHRGRPVAGLLPGWSKGSVGLRKGKSNELDEFTLEDKKKLVRAAWADHLTVTARIREGWQLVTKGSDPAQGGWDSPANLLWAIAHRDGACEQIADHLQWADLPLPLSDLLPVDVDMRIWKRTLMRTLVRRIYPHQMDLHCYRILLMAATGRAPEEVTGLTEDSLEFGPRSVLIDFTKNRAHARTRQAFSTLESHDLSDASLHPSRPRLDASELTRAMLELSRPLATRINADPVPLFLRASVHNHAFRIAPFHGGFVHGNFAQWLQDHDVRVEGAIDIRRLRKSGKVEKALAFKGRVSDIADDHTEETYRNHYAHGTTLRVIAGNIITTAQKRWLDKALEGPTVLTEDAESHLNEPAAAGLLGLSPEEIDELRAGELDMGVCSCKNPFASPFGRPGQLCPVAPTRCLECRNAFILPSNLPQLLLFSDHLDQLQVRLSPRHFHALWGQSRVNVREAISARTDIEITQARRHISEADLGLHLPLGSHVEFDA
ncbi:hypothetical protein ACFV98_17605 [Streptomyces violascens]|uniref:hypothetical protein n=1 Tax=Streptomyces violascens TaxID=67381 RepID=UPI00364F9085